MESAHEILERGFQDSTGYFLGVCAWRGVWLSAIPVSSARGRNDALLRVTLNLSEDELARWEWTGEKQSARTWLIPAALINARMTAELVLAEGAPELAA